MIEDAAQAHGATILHEGVSLKTGALGTVSCFSFFPSKNVAVGGEGGMITSSHPDIGARIKSIVDHGRDGTLQSQEVGTNMRMSEVFAAIGRKQLKHLDEWLAKRRSTAATFKEVLEFIPALSAPSIRPDSKHAWHQYCIQTNDVDSFIKHMASQNIDARQIYPVPCHQHPVYAGHLQAKERFATTEELCQKLVAIPVHHGLTVDEINRIVDALQSYS